MTAIENVSLVRESSATTTYLVVGDVKFRIADQAEFAALGLRSSRVRVVSDSSLKGFQEQRLRPVPATLPSDVYTFESGCRQTYWAIDGNYYSNCVGASFIARRHVLIAGWLQAGHPHFNRSEPHGLEDVFYDLDLDPVFLERMYGVNGLSEALVSARWPGHLLDPERTAPASLRMAAIPAPAGGGQRGTPFSSWILPGVNVIGIHPELPAWHVKDHPPFGSFSSHWQGRGDAPTGRRPLAGDGNAWFPFDPVNPEAAEDALTAGDYIVIRGSLWQDHNHGSSGLWNTGPTLGQADWVAEIHPPDWLCRTSPPGPNARVTPRTVDLCTPGATGPGISQDVTITPDSATTSSFRTLRVRRGWGEVDLNCADGSTLVRYGVTPHEDNVTAVFSVAPTGTRQGRYKGAVFAGWSELDSRDEVWVDDELPTGAITAAEGGDSWQWTGTAPYPFTGTVAHRSAPASGLHQHFFWAASTTLMPRRGDRLFTMVYIDPEQPPDEIMLQFFVDGSWEHRAYWGDDRIPWGAPGTRARLRMGGLPASGEWVRLETDAQTLGLADATISGAAFTCYGGSVLWDRTGVQRATPWQDVGHANEVVALTELRSRLYCITSQDQLWSRDQATNEVPWRLIGSAGGCTTVTGLVFGPTRQARLWGTTADNSLMARPLETPHGEDPEWTRAGHANQVVALAARGSRLYCADRENRLWRRRPVMSDESWTRIGHAIDVVAMTASSSHLYCVTRDSRLWARTPTDADRDWDMIGWSPPGSPATGLTVIAGYLWATTLAGRLYRLPL